MNHSALAVERAEPGRSVRHIAMNQGYTVCDVGRERFAAAVDLRMKAVEDRDRVAGREQPAGDSKTDEAGPACDENTHRFHEGLCF